LRCLLKVQSLLPILRLVLIDFDAFGDIRVE